MLPIKRIFCPTDFSEPSREGLKNALELASMFKAEVCLVHILPVMPALPPDPNFVFRVPEYEQALHAEAAQKLRALAEEAIPKNVRARTIVGHGDAGSEIARLAEKEGADLIVLATHGMTGWRHMVFGSVAEKVVRLAHCSVLAVRASHQ